MTLRALAIAGLLLASCGGAASPTTAATDRPAASIAAATAPTANTPAATYTSAPAATSAATRASANNGTNAELIAALTANGVPSPANWAREVQEYRPYPITDTSFAKLKGELAKYNPSAGTLTKILASLSLP